MVSTHVSAHATSRCTFKTANTSKFSASLITQQQSKSIGVRLLARKHKKATAGSRRFFATEDISKVEEKFGRSAIEGHRTRPDGSDLKWKQIGVNEITDSRELPFFIQWLTADHPSQDGKAVAAIEKITIADTDHLSDSWFKTEILGGLNGADVEFIDPSANDGEYGIVAVHLKTPSGSVVLD